MYLGFAQPRGKSSHPLKLLKSTCPSKGQSSEPIILTPPETAGKHVSFQGAELGADYFSAC
eukprot:30056-Prymnesium_polylepis.1